MKTIQTQIKLNLPLPLKELLESKARRFGVPMATYLRHLIITNVEDMEYPVYQASEAMEKKYEQAIREKDKAVKVDGDIGKFLDNL